MRRIFLLIIASLMLLVSAGCSGAPLSRTDFLFDTVVSVTVHGGKQADLNAAFELCRRYDALLSKTHNGSDVWRVNHAEGEPVEVSAEVIEILNIAEKYYYLSDGLFDVTCGAETDLWDFSAASPAVPEPERLSEAVARTGFENLHTDGNLVWLGNGAKLELGAVAKGYIADRVADLLRERGVSGAVIDLGGDVVTLGSKKDGTPWSVAIRSPEGGGYAGVLESGECAMVTSGVYERFFELDGKRYHHIIDPRTGMPADTDIMSVTVITASAAEGDAISTTCLLLGSNRAMELLSAMPNVDAYFILNDGRTIATREGLVN